MSLHFKDNYVQVMIINDKQKLKIITTCISNICDGCGMHACMHAVYMYLKIANLLLRNYVQAIPKTQIESVGLLQNTDLPTVLFRLLDILVPMAG